MISKFRQWYLRNFEAITWFLIGWLCLGGLTAFWRNDFTTALICWAIAFLNFISVKR